MPWTNREDINLTAVTESLWSSTPMTFSPTDPYNDTEPIFSLRNTVYRTGELLDSSKEPEGVSYQVVIWALIDGFLLLAIVSGNVLTIAAIFMNRTIHHTVSNQFILSLACSDLFVGLMLPYHMMFYIEPTLGEIFGFCIARLALMSLACTASVMNIIAIAVDRFLAIVYPLHYKKLMTKRLARTIVTIAWILGISISVIPIFWNKWKKNSRMEESRERCELGYVIVPLYVETIYLPCCVLLFAIMFGFYVKIFSESRKHAKRMRQINYDIPDTWKSLQVLMLVMGSFTISYMPFIVVVILNSIFQHKTTSVVYKVTNSLAVANSAVNPLIYAWKNHQFKKAFSKMIHCKTADGNSIELFSNFRMIRRKK